MLPTMTPPVREQLWTRIEALSAKCERWKVPLFALFSLLFFTGSFLVATTRTMWTDELFTLYVSRFPNLSDVWRALSTGAEQTPPLFFVITRASCHIFGVNKFGIRFPEALAFWGMCLCLYFFVSKRSSALCGLIAALFACSTGAIYYATEGRTYGLVLGFAALALICWQWATEGRGRPLALAGLCLSLAAAICCHYYAILLLFPLGLGELVRSLKRRRIDWPVWAAMVLSPAPLILLIPLIESARSYAVHFWGKPRWLYIFFIYHGFLLRSATILLMALWALVMAYAALRPYLPEPRITGKILRAPAHEIAAVFGFILLPVVGIILAKVAVGAWSDRYVLPIVIGLSIAVAWGLYSALDGRASMLLASVCILFAFFFAKEAKHYIQAIAGETNRSAAYAFIEAHAKPPEPIVIANPHNFMALAYRPPKDLQNRLVYLADVKLSLEDTGTDVSDRGLIQASRWTGIDVQPLEAFVASSHGFLVYAAYPDVYQYLVPELAKMHLNIHLVASSSNQVLLSVSPDGDQKSSRALQ